MSNHHPPGHSQIPRFLFGHAGDSMPGSQTEARARSLVRYQQAHPVTGGGRAFLHQLHVPSGSLQLSRGLKGSVTTPSLEGPPGEASTSGEKTTDARWQCWGCRCQSRRCRRGGGGLKQQGLTSKPKADRLARHRNSQT